MNQRPITVTLSTQNLTVQPSGNPAALEILVRNDSDQQAQFQVELLVPGADPSAGSEWYRLEPEVSVAKPPGDTTPFQALVFGSPLLNFSGTTTLTVRVTSPQLPGEERRVLRLTILPGAIAAPVSVSFMPPHLQTYPRNAVDITVRVRNLTYQPLEVLLKLSGILPGWLPNGTDRTITLAPNAEQVVPFACHPPALTHAPSRPYGLRVEAMTKGRGAIAAEGILEVLPIGFIQFAVNPVQQTVPVNGRMLPDWKTKTATLYADLENLSNVEQKVGLTVQNEVPPDCQWELPLPADLGLGQSVKLPLQVQVTRPWVGLDRRLKLLLAPQLQNSNAVEVEPPQQAIDLTVLPIIPLWLVLTLLALLLALLVWLLRPLPPGHTDAVNAVRFDGTGVSVVSGSQDCSVRWWTVEGDRLRPEGEFSDPVPSTSCSPSPRRQGIVALAGKSINVLEFSPKQNNWVAAGIDDGSIQILELRRRRLVQQIQDPDDQKTDRVFALTFTNDASILFSGYGSGTIRVWQSKRDGMFGERPLTRFDVPGRFTVRSLALNSDGTLVSAGEKNSLYLWQSADWRTPPVSQRIQSLAGDKSLPFAQFFWSSAFLPNSKTLATSDSSGNLALWQLDQCQPDGPNLRCPMQFKQASTVPNLSIRTVRPSQDGRWLVTAGDDGRVMLWPLTEKHQFAAEAPQMVYQNSADPMQIPTVDVKNRERDLLIVMGGYDYQVQLRHFP